MDSVGNILAERQADRVPWGPATALALILHAAVFGGLLFSLLAKPMKYSKPRAVAVRLLRAGAIRPEVRTAPAPPAPAVAERPKIEKPVEEVPKPSEKAVLLPSKDDKKKPTPPPISRPGKPVATPAVNLPTSDEEAPASAGPSGPAAGAGGTAGIGGFQVEQADFKYAYYIEGMQRILFMNWFNPVQVVPTKPVVRFQILRDGTATEIQLLKSSGLPYVDRAALRAVMASSPFPPLPADYPGPLIGIQVVFE
jgi:TonB family protein